MSNNRLKYSNQNFNIQTRMQVALNERANLALNNFMKRSDIPSLPNPRDYDIAINFNTRVHEQTRRGKSNQEAAVCAAIGSGSRAITQIAANFPGLAQGVGNFMQNGCNTGFDLFKNTVSRLETAIPRHSNPKFPIPFKAKNFNVDNDPTFAINESFDYKTRIPVRIKASINGNDVFAAIGRGLGAACDNLIDLAKNPQDLILAPLNLVVDGMVIRDANQYKTYKTIFNNTPVDPDIGKFARNRMNQRIDHVAGGLRHFYTASPLDKIEMLTEFGVTVYVPGKLASGIKFLKPSVLRETTLVKKLGLGVEWEYLYRGDETLKKNIISAMTRKNDSTFTKEYLKKLSPGALSDLYYNHAFCNEGTPFVSTSKNARVAAYFAKGNSQIQQGYVTTIRISKNKFYKLLSSNELIPNFESPMFQGINHNIGLSESEYLFTDRIPKKYIHKQIKVEDFNPYDPHPNVRNTHKALGSTLQSATALTISTGNVTMTDHSVLPYTKSSLDEQNKLSLAQRLRFFSQAIQDVKPVSMQPKISLPKRQLQY